MSDHLKVGISWLSFFMQPVIFLVWWMILKFYLGHHGYSIKSLSFLGLAHRLLLYAVVAMTFNIQSHCNAVLVCLAYLVSCAARGEGRSLCRLGPSGLQGREGSTWPMGGHRWREFVAGSPLHVCLGGGGNLRPARVGEHLSWSLFVSGASGLSLLSVLPYLVLSYSEVRSLPGLPSLPVSCGLGNARPGAPSSSGWGSPQMPVTLTASGPRSPASLLLPPFRRLLRLLLVLFPGFIVVVRGRSREKWVYTTVSRPDIRSVHRYWRPSVNSLWKMRTHDLQNLCGLSGMASWEQRAIETAKVKPQMSPGKTWLIAKWMTWARNTGDPEEGKINASPRLTWAINHHSFSMVATPIGHHFQMKEASSW